MRRFKGKHAAAFALVSVALALTCTHAPRRQGEPLPGMRSTTAVVLTGELRIARGAPPVEGGAPRVHASLLQEDGSRWDVLLPQEIADAPAATTWNGLRVQAIADTTGLPAGSARVLYIRRLKPSRH